MKRTCFRFNGNASLVHSSLGRKPNHWWSSMKNQRQFMESIRMEEGFYFPDSWTYKWIKKNGGSSLLYYYKSIPNLISAIYPEYKNTKYTTIRRYPNGYWDIKENHFDFLDKFADENSISTIEQWKKVKTTEIIKFGGNSLLSKYPSFFVLLQEYFKHSGRYDVKKILDDDNTVQNIQEIRNSYPNGFWKDKNNQKQFLDNLAIKLNIKSYKDWNTISRKDIVQQGGARIFEEFPSFYDCLKYHYPDENWDASERNSIPKNYWDSDENIKSFLLKVKQIYELKTNEDWYRISTRQIHSIGGEYLLRKYSLYDLVSKVFPDEIWEKGKFIGKNKRSGQRILFLIVKKLFPDDEIIEEYLHKELSRISGFSIEFDVFIVNKNIAFEFQGEHHYQDTPSFGSIEMFLNRDNEKNKLAKEAGIKLIEIPHWVKLNSNSISTIVKNNLS